MREKLVILNNLTHAIRGKTARYIMPRVFFSDMLHNIRRNTKKITWCRHKHHKKKYNVPLRNVVA